MNPIINQMIGFAKQEAEVLAPAVAEKQSHVWKVDAAGLHKLNKIMSWYVAKQPCMTAKVLLVKIFKLLESGTDAELLLSPSGGADVYHILTDFAVSHELPESVVESLKEVS